MPAVERYKKHTSCVIFVSNTSTTPAVLFSTVNTLSFVYEFVLLRIRLVISTSDISVVNLCTVSTFLATRIILSCSLHSFSEAFILHHLLCMVKASSFIFSMLSDRSSVLLAPSAFLFKATLTLVVLSITTSHSHTLRSHAHRVPLLMHLLSHHYWLLMHLLVWLLMHLLVVHLVLLKMLLFFSLEVTSHNFTNCFTLASSAKQVIFLFITCLTKRIIFVFSLPKPCCLAFYTLIALFTELFKTFKVSSYVTSI